MSQQRNDNTQRIVRESMFRITGAHKKRTRVSFTEWKVSSNRRASKNHSPRISAIRQVLSGGRHAHKDQEGRDGQKAEDPQKG